MENFEFKSFNNIVNNINLTILEHGYLHTGMEWKFLNLKSPFNRMYFVIDGSGRISNEDNDLELTGGNVYLIPLEKTYDYVCDSTLHMFYIHFRVELIPGHDLFEDYYECADYPMDVTDVESLVQAAERTQVGDLIKCKGMFFSCIGRFIEPISSQLDEQMHLMGDYNKVYEYVKNNCYADLRIKDIASRFGMNVSTFSKGFKISTIESYNDNGDLIDHVQALWDLLDVQKVSEE